MIQLLLNKTTPPFQLLPMPKVDLSQLHIHEAPPLQQAKCQVISSGLKGLHVSNFVITCFHIPLYTYAIKYV